MPSVTHATPDPGPGAPLVVRLRSERVLAVVRAVTIADAGELCRALVDGGIRVVELTFTTPGVARHLEVAAAYAASSGDPGCLVGAGTVLGAEQARAAVDAGAAFLVTPGVGRFAEGVVTVARAAGVPVILGALTPSEVLEALALGADAVKIFPATLGGPRLLQDLSGPFPDVPLVPSGGITAQNARDFLDAGAVAVSAGSGVVPPAAVASGDWRRITAAARDFRAHLRAPDGPRSAPLDARAGVDDSEER
jgi:2-dehydro-3-deoxyphosphogluconate aldolase / (4S)-4-hydroxy-2-oxoglutarate aldolase